MSMSPHHHIGTLARAVQRTAFPRSTPTNAVARKASLHLRFMALAHDRYEQ
jgi:hypothetical protein